MSLVYSPHKPKKKVTPARAISTDRVCTARAELIAALKESLKVADLTGDEAEAGMSCLFSGIWLEAENLARLLPGYRAREGG